jgi:ribosomal protein L7/L12
MERPISAKELAEVQAAVFKGQKITAIKIYREDTGASLADAKNAVEKLESEWRAASPENFTAPTKQKGCGVCLALVVFGILALVLLLFLARRG